MWFGTDRGLNRFDGTNFKVFLNNLADSTSIPFNSIDFLFEDIDHKLWIRSLEQFVMYDLFQKLSAERAAIAGIPIYRCIRSRI